MKSKILPLVFAAVMMVSMTACGTTNNADNPNAGQGSGSTSVGDNSANGGTDDGTTGNESGSNGGVLGNEGTGSQSGALDNNGTVNGTGGGSASGSAGSASGASAQRGGQPIVRSATYEQMLHNARIHDTDGDLTDGENAVTPGIVH